MLSQLPAPSTTAIGDWLIAAAATGSIFLILKKFFPAKRPVPVQTSTPADLHHELSLLSDKLDSRFLLLSEKIEHLSTSLHQRLDSIHSAIARLDERSKSPRPLHF